MGREGVTVNPVGGGRSVLEGDIGSEIMRRRQLAKNRKNKIPGRKNSKYNPLGSRNRNKAFGLTFGRTP